MSSPCTRKAGSVSDSARPRLLPLLLGSPLQGSSSHWLLGALCLPCESCHGLNCIPPPVPQINILKSYPLPTQYCRMQLHLESP